MRNLGKKIDSIENAGLRIENAGLSIESTGLTDFKLYATQRLWHSEKSDSDGLNCWRRRRISLPGSQTP
jgi:hypothetical protein